MRTHIYMNICIEIYLTLYTTTSKIHCVIVSFIAIYCLH